MRAIDQVRNRAPEKAVTYRLSYRGSDGSITTIPKVAYLPLRTAPPLGIPSGKYTILYFGPSGKQLREANRTLTLNAAEEQGQFHPHVELGTGRIVSGPALAAHSEDAGSHGIAEEDEYGIADGPEFTDQRDVDERTEDDEEQCSDVQGDEGSVEALADEDEESERALERRIKEQTKMFVLQMRQQELHNKFLLKSQYTKEIGENLQLNGVYRRDFAEMSRILTETHRDRRIEMNKLAADMQRNNDKYMERVDDLLARNDQLVAALAEAHRTPPPHPPPPPDYVSLGHSTLAMLQNIWLGLSAQKADMLKTLSQPSLPSSGSVPADSVKQEGAEAVTRVAPLPDTQLKVNTAPAPAPETQPANVRTGDMLRAYMSTLNELDAAKLFRKDPAEVTKWIEHLNAALAQPPVTESIDQGPGT